MSKPCRVLVTLTVAMTTDRAPWDLTEGLMRFLYSELVDNNHDASFDPDPSVEIEDVAVLPERVK